MVFPAEVCTVPVAFSSVFQRESVGRGAVPYTLCFSVWSCGIEVHKIRSCLVCLFTLNLPLVPACLRPV